MLHCSNVKVSLFFFFPAQDDYSSGGYGNTPAGNYSTPAPSYDDRGYSNTGSYGMYYALLPFFFERKFSFSCGPDTDFKGNYGELIMYFYVSDSQNYSSNNSSYNKPSYGEFYPL